MKKFISVLLAALMVLATLTVSAASALTVNPADVDLSTQTVTITGTGTANSSFILLVTNPGKTQTDVDLSGSAVQNMREVKIDANGEFIYKFALYAPAEGEYNVYADGDNKGKFKVAVESLVSDVDAILAAARDNNLAVFTAKVTDLAVMENFAINEYAPLVSSQIALDKNKYAVKLLEAVRDADAASEFNGTAAQNGAKLQLLIKKIAALEVLNQGKATIHSFNTDGTFKYDSALKVSDIDAKYSITVYEYYAEGSEKNGTKYTLSAEGKTQVQNALLNKNFENEEELYKAFIEAAVCAGVNKAAQVGASSYTGYGHVNALLTEANKAIAGVKGEITDYVAKNLAGNRTKITSVETLNALIQALSNGESSDSGITGGGAGGGGGISVPVTKPDQTINNDNNAANSYKYKFDDIASVEWAIEAIEYLYTKGVINGKADRVFDPENTVTREEIVKMISIAVGLTEEAEINFADVEGSSWAKPFIAKAVKAGIISGISETEFGFGRNVTRQDIATMLYRVIGKQETVTESTFADNGAVADYAKEAISVLSEKKIINGFEDNTFRPEDSCTRAQAAVIIYNYLKTAGLAN